MKNQNGSAVSIDHLIVMGVSGSGKSTLGKALATRLGLPFVEGDEFHPEINIQKMRSGQPLNDADRLDWLNQLREQLSYYQRRQQSVVLACSALKKSYRDRLRQASNQLGWVYLWGSQQLLQSRLEARENHFMPSQLLDSQLLALEPPIQEPSVFECQIHLPLNEQVEQVLHYFQLTPNTQHHPKNKTKKR